MTLGELLTGLGYVVGAIVFYLASRDRNLATSGMGLVALVGGVGGVLGARLTQFVSEGWPLRHTAAILDPRTGGKALLGGILIGWLCIKIAKRRLGIKRCVGDHFALALLAGEAVGRLGCFYNGCCYGQPCNLPWAVWQHGAWRHPTQLYSAATALVMLVVLVAIRKRMKADGDLFRIYLIGFGVTRFGIESLRWQDHLVYGLSLMQWFCIDLILFALFMFWMSRRFGPKKVMA